MEGQTSTMISGVMCKNKFRMRYMTLRRILMITREVFWGINLMIIRSIYLIGRSRGRVDIHGGELLMLW